MEESVFYNLSQDETLGGDSPSIHKIPSQAALKAYIDSKAGSGGPNYFYVEDASGAANTLTIKKSNNALPDKVFEWSLDKQTWTTVTVTDTTGVSIAVPANGRVYLRGDNILLTGSNGNYYTLINCSSYYAIGGDITTLVAKIGAQMTVPKYCFKSVFDSGSQGMLTSVSQLIIPIRNCLESIFTQCFRDNKYLIDGGCEIDFDQVAYGAFDGMFWGCIALTVPPILKSHNVNSYCYKNMFNGCTSLTTAPILPAENPPSNCYDSMFRNCTALNHVEVYATTWNGQSDWLNGVSATGDFYNLGGATIPTGTNGIPSGWTEHTQLP